MTSFGYIEDGFGGSWSLCKPKCGLHVVRPGKVQCECDFDCPCGGRLTNHSEPDPRWPNAAGWFCDKCGPFGQKEDTEEYIPSPRELVPLWRVPVPDPDNARIKALEAELAALKAVINNDGSLTTPEDHLSICQDAMSALERIGDMGNRLDGALTKLAEWRVVGAELEWCIYDTDKKEGFIRICPSCHGKYDKHTKDCELAKLLGRKSDG